MKVQLTVGWIMDPQLIMEALAMAASRHESLGSDTQGQFRYSHFNKADNMRRIRREIEDQLHANPPRR